MSFRSNYSGLKTAWHAYRVLFQGQLDHCGLILVGLLEMQPQSWSQEGAKEAVIVMGVLLDEFISCKLRPGKGKYKYGMEE